jgi:tetratricopeptide (TPR) repeat protein
MAFDLLEKGNVDEALTITRRFARERPDFAEAHALYGFVLTESQVFLGPSSDSPYIKAAINACNYAIRLNDNYSGAYFVRAMALFLSGRNDNQVIVDCRKAIRLNEDAFSAQLLLASVFLEIGEYDRAIRAANTIIDRQHAEIANFVSSAYVLRGQAFGEIKRFGSGIRDFLNATSVDPKNADARIQLRLALAQIDDMYYSDVMGEQANIKTFAAEKGITVVQLEEIVDSWKAANCVSDVPTPQQIQIAKVKARLDGLLRRYEERLMEMNLPEGVIETKKEADAAARLATTLRDVQRLQAELRLPLTETPERVKQMEALAAVYRRSHDKTGKPVVPKTRGRPRSSTPDPS